MYTSRVLKKALVYRILMVPFFFSMHKKYHDGLLIPRVVANTTSNCEDHSGQGYTCIYFRLTFIITKYNMEEFLPSRNMFANFQQYRKKGEEKMEKKNKKRIDIAL